eukprot:TRINITY_DN3645_c0_g1_i1.p2 TRINITY_DN3645_c0_g1~~TRINITY_DN3645_c0_g1_i1.p2  ORF type:complete len:118 (-),score=12.47 TRINITY_DN3645_c0_g1_i1:710-1063(-)
MMQIFAGWRFMHISYCSGRFDRGIRQTIRLPGDVMKHLPFSALLALGLAGLLAGCATESPATGEKIVREESYAPVGTMIPRKNGTGLGAAPITAVDKNAVENARAMQSNGVAGRPGL